MQMFKNAMKKITSGDIDTRIARFLFQYRITPHSTTGISPAELLQGRRLRSHLDLLQPHLQSKIQESQERQKTKHNQGARSRTFQVSDLVWIRNFGQGQKRLPGTVLSIRAPLSYVIKLDDDMQRSSKTRGSCSPTNCTSFHPYFN